MKKIVAFALCFILAQCLCFSLAESVDITALSDDELIALRDAINEEIDVRMIASGSYLPWFNNGLGATLPDFNDVVGREVEVKEGLNRNSDKMFVRNLVDVEQDEFEIYCLACIDYGYSDVIEQSDTSFEAVDGAGNTLRILKIYKNVKIDVDAP